MFVRPGARQGARSANAVLASVPWVVVLLGVGLMVVLLLFAVLSFRGSEREAAPVPAPPLYLPTLPAVSGTPVPSDSPLSAVSGTPSRSAGPRVAPPAATSAAQEVRGTGNLTGRYRVLESYRDSFVAQVVVDNDSARSRDWVVELLFPGNVKDIQASSTGSGVSVTSSNGHFTLRGTSSLAAGESVTLRLRFDRNGTVNQPSQCTVNGIGCAIG